MRLNRKKNVKRRRGMTFIEVISSMIITSMLIGAIVGAGALLLDATRQSVNMRRLQVFVVNQIERIQGDLEEGLLIEALDYSDPGINSGIWSDIVITDVGDVFGKSLYLVELSLRVRDTKDMLISHVVLREGCTAYAP